MSYDTTAIRQATDLVALAERDTALRGGSERYGPCPKCGGDDRFHCTATWWFCRQCHPQRGDAIEYLRWRDGLGFREACERLDGGNSARSLPRTVQTAAPRSAFAEAEPPGPVWQARARSFVGYAQEQLWEDAQALDYLRNRGLADATIREARLGYCPKDWRNPAEHWGLSAERYPRGVWVPRGWVIPCEMAGALWYVKARRPEGRPKYACVSGSVKRGVVYGLDDVGDVWDLVLCEGEFNALILRQVMAGVCGVASLGDAGNLPGAAALSVLGRIPRWWGLYDPDAAGEQGSDKLGALSARVRTLAWPWGDLDANAAHMRGEDLVAVILPQIGPKDPEKRGAWLRYWGRTDGTDKQPAASQDEGKAESGGIADMLPYTRYRRACVASGVPPLDVDGWRSAGRPTSGVPGVSSVASPNALSDRPLVVGDDVLLIDGQGNLAAAKPTRIREIVTHIDGTRWAIISGSKTGWPLERCVLARTEDE